MTAHKHLKSMIRARMRKTGESYTSARRQVMRQEPATTPDPTRRWHVPGNVAATTALRVLVTQAGSRAAHTGEPYSEAMLFGIAGGVGAGVFSFVYEKADFASFFIAGRHNWQDDQAYLVDACRRLGFEPVVQETSSAKIAADQLRAMLQAGPCAAWVDMAHLPHRGLPAHFSGGGYHVITVYQIDESSRTATIGDLADVPIVVSLEDLAQARGRIKKQSHRLLSISGPAAPRTPAGLVKEGLRSCHEGRDSIGSKVMANFTLEAFRTWGTRMHGSKDKESWERVFPRGKRLWGALTSIYDYIENYGGSGLCRPIFAEFLAEAAAATGVHDLRALGERYAELGRGWRALAASALPDGVPAFEEARRLLDAKSELTVGDGGSDPTAVRQAWQRLGELAEGARNEFPLSEEECRALRAGLQERILSLHRAEVAAHEALGDVQSALPAG